jgi:hypothetical protein
MENIILCEVSHVLKARGCMFSLMWNIDPIQIQIILWKADHTKGRSHMRERGEKKVVKKVNMVDVLPTQEWI